MCDKNTISSVKEKVDKFETEIKKLRTVKKQQDTSLMPQNIQSDGQLEQIKKKGSSTYLREEDTLTSCNINSLHIKECWICLSDEGGGFIRPCSCKGSTKYVHRECFISYIGSKNYKNLKCTFCKTKYNIKAPRSKFISAYEITRNINAILCNTILIVTVISVLYTLLFAYGMSVILFFVGKQALIRYIYQDIYLFLINAYGFNILRILLGTPLIPVILVFSMHKKFSYVFHVVPSLILIDTIDCRWLVLYFMPLILFFYNLIMDKIQRKLGRIDTETGSVIVNNHFFEMKKLVGVLISPFIGALFGLTVFWCCNMKKITKTFSGFLIYVVLKDVLCILYLLAIKKRNNGLRIIEFNDY